MDECCIALVWKGKISRKAGEGGQCSRKATRAGCCGGHEEDEAEWCYCSSHGKAIEAGKHLHGTIVNPSPHFKKGWEGRCEKSYSSERGIWSEKEKKIYDDEGVECWNCKACNGWEDWGVDCGCVDEGIVYENPNKKTYEEWRS